MRHRQLIRLTTPLGHTFGWKVYRNFHCIFSDPSLDDDGSFMDCHRVNRPSSNPTAKLKNGATTFDGYWASWEERREETGANDTEVTAALKGGRELSSTILGAAEEEDEEPGWSTRKNLTVLSREPVAKKYTELLGESLGIAAVEGGSVGGSGAHEQLHTIRACAFTLVVATCTFFPRSFV